MPIPDNWVEDRDGYDWAMSFQNKHNIQEKLGLECVLAFMHNVRPSALTCTFCQSHTLALAVVL